MIERNPTYGWNHSITLHAVEEEYVPGCRFWEQTGTVSALEILENYSEYQGYKETREIWEVVRRQTWEGVPSIDTFDYRIKYFFRRNFGHLIVL